jgi:predicted amidohydrolase
MKIWLMQMETVLEDKVKNVLKIHSCLDRAASGRVNLIVFLELVLTGYACGIDFFNLAEPIPGPSTKEIMEGAVRGERAEEEILEVHLTREDCERYRFRLPVLRDVRPEIAEEYLNILRKR